MKEFQKDLNKFIDVTLNSWKKIKILQSIIMCQTMHNILPNHLIITKNNYRSLQSLYLIVLNL